MFRRKRAQSNPPRNRAPPTPTSAATTAAAQAFLANRASNASLSSAAAATALRSFTPTPTSPGNITTKRMLRRQNSAGSTGSAPAGLYRRGSNASLTERTFRVQSPNRFQQLEEVPPPLPPMPHALSEPAKPKKKKRSKNAVSDAQGANAAQSDVGSLNSSAPGSRLSSVDIERRSPAPHANGTPKRISVNFSRPISPSPPHSPTMQSIGNGISGDVKPESAAAAAPIKKKKKKKPVAADGTPVAVGTAHSQGVDQTAPAAPATQPPPAEAKPKKKKKPRPAQSATDSQEPEPQRSSPAERPANSGPGKLLSKKPSVVREDREAEEEEERLANERKGSIALSVSSQAGSEGGKPRGKKKSTLSGSDVPNMTPSSERPKRASPSPSRSAHFSSKPVESTGQVKHQPPPRSVSPAKPALKHSPSPRGLSPNPNRLSYAGSEVSDAGSHISEDPNTGERRKSVRVSFDASPLVVGEAAGTMASQSPILPSPQNKETPTKKGWAGFRRNKPKPQADDDDDDEYGVLKPTPALPSFGSIRERRDETAESEPSKSAVDHSSEKSAQTSDRAPKPKQEALKSAFKTHQAVAEEPTPAEQESASKEENAREGEVQTQPEAGADSGKKGDGSTLRVHVPEIAVLPATPGFDENAGPKESWLDGDEVETPKRSGSTSEEHPSTPATIGISEPEPEVTAGLHEPGTPVVGHVAELIKHQSALLPETESEYDTSSSVYNDDLPAPDDLDGDGFGSIDAIVDSPDMPRSSTQLDSPPMSPIDLGAKKNAEESETETESEYEKPTPPPLPVKSEKRNSLKAAPAAAPVAAKAKTTQRPAQPVETEQPKPAMKASPNAQAPTKKKKAKAPTRDEQINREVAAILAANKTQAATGPQKKPAQKPAQKLTQKPAQKPAQNTDRNSAFFPEPSSPVTKTSKKPIAMRKSMREEPSSLDAPRPSSSSGAPPRRTQSGPDREPRMGMAKTLRNGPPPRRKSKQSPKPIQTRSELYPLTESQPVTVGSRPKGRKLTRPSSAAGDYRPTSPASLSRPRPMSMVNLTSPTMPAVPEDAPPMPRLDRTLSAGSDSDTSFKRTRRSKPRSESGFSMRRSMRSTESVPTMSRNRFSLRASSPRGSNNRPLSPSSIGSEGRSMRMSMRRNSDADDRKPAMKGLLGRMKSKDNRAKDSTTSLQKQAAEKVSAAVAAATPKRAPKFKSKIADSSDEEDDDDIPRTFKSRFDDSSDEEPEDLPPVRGIPRVNEEGDSTDLDDSEPEEPAKGKVTKKDKAASPAVPSSPVAASPAPSSPPASSDRRPSFQFPTKSILSNGTGRGSILGKAPSTEKKKFSLFGRIKGRKEDTSRIGKISVENAARPNTPSSRVDLTDQASSVVAATSGTATPTRPKTPLAQTTTAAAATAENESTPGSATEAATPASRGPSVDKPLPVPPPIPESPALPPGMVRRITSDGVTGGGGAPRRVLTKESANASVGHLPKKKRFMSLRKALRMQD